MKVRDIYWYRTDVPKQHVLARFVWGGWFQYSFLDKDNFGYIRTREEFEKHYLEWKSQNEG